MCLRSEGDETHSVSRFQAACRETVPCMATTVAEDTEPATSEAPFRPSEARAQRRRRPRATAPGAPQTPTNGHAPGQAPPHRASLRKEMEKFVIEGGTPLSGTIVPAGNKNGALPILAACLLTEDEVILRNVPRIRDVEAMALLLEGLAP